MQAQSSGADVIGLANAGGDLYTAMKQAHEFGLTQKQKLATFVLNVTDMPALGIETAQGATVATPFYWDFNDQDPRVRQALSGKAPEEADAERHAGRHVFGDRAPVEDLTLR